MIILDVELTELQENRSILWRIGVRNLAYTHSISVRKRGNLIR